MLSNLPDINCPDLLIGLPSANLTFKPLLDVIDVRFTGIEPVLRDDSNPTVTGLTVQPEGHLIFSEIAPQKSSVPSTGGGKPRGDRMPQIVETDVWPFDGIARLIERGADR